MRGGSLENVLEDKNENHFEKAENLDQTKVPNAIALVGGSHTPLKAEGSPQARITGHLLREAVLPKRKRWRSENILKKPRRDKCWGELDRSQHKKSANKGPGLEYETAVFE